MTDKKNTFSESKAWQAGQKALEYEERRAEREKLKKAERILKKAEKRKRKHELGPEGELCVKDELSGPSKQCTTAACAPPPAGFINGHLVC